MHSWNIVFTEKGKVEVISEPVEPLANDEVLCKADKSLISIGTELTCLSSEFDPDTNWYSWVKYPFRPGYSMSAIVMEVGPDVSCLKPGDRVFSGCSHMEYFKAKPSQLTRIPDGVTSEEATWISLSRVAQNGVRKAQIQMGDTVGVVGLGPVGQLTIQYIKNCGATRIIGIDPIEERGSFALKSGATDVLSVKADQAYSQIEDYTKGLMLDVIFDTTGHPTVLSSCCKLVRRYGKVILVGDTPQPSKQYLGPGVVSNYISILGAHGGMVAPEPNYFYPWTLEKTTEITLDYIINGKMTCKHLITHRYSPREAPSIYRKILHDRSYAMGIIFDWCRLSH